MVIMNRREGEESEAPEVDERSCELMAEFEGHFREVVELDPGAENRREHVFQAWTMQKIAGLQLAVEELARNFNAQIGSPEA